MVYQKKTKRWHLSASANVPFLGKTSVSMGDEKRKIQRRQLRDLIKTTVTKRAEQKYKEIGDIGVTGALMNTHYTYNILGSIPEGTNQISRIGDKIQPITFNAKLRVMMGSTPSQHYCRIMLIRSSLEFGGGSSTFTSTGFGSATLFHTGNDITRSFVDPSLVTVLSDKVHKMPQRSYSGNIESSIYSLNHKFTGPFLYKDGSDYSKNKNYYVVVSMFAEGGTTGLTACGDIFFTSVCKFTDL